MHADYPKTNPPVTPKALSGLAAMVVNHPRLGWLGRKQLAWIGLPLIAVVSFLAVGSGSPPAYPLIALSADPLYAAAAVDKPAIALALSVEYPTVGAQYVATASATTDGSYSNTTEYLGYYNAESCYTYVDAPTESVVAPLVASDYKRFQRVGNAIALTTADATQPFKTSRKCNDAFSGNFLNWASNSAIDMLRLALTGGDRTVDTAGTFNADGSVITYPLTILQRAVIPNGDPICMWNSSNFPAKQLLNSGGTSGTAFFGAVPNAMATAAGTNDIWIANTLDRIYFGTSKTGNCGTGPASYTLSATLPAATSQMGPITNSSASLPGGSTLCAAENGNCTGFAGTKEIWYGAGTTWKVAPATGSVSCSNAVFGDPIGGTSKNCYYKTYSGTWTPVVTGTGGLNSDGFFYARVQVCDVNSAGVLQDSREYGSVGTLTSDAVLAPGTHQLCKKYPNGNYKPEAVIQKYSDQIRLSAFGYLMDPTASYSSGRYGGVLRAPMKYVGAKTFDVNGTDNTVSGGNPKREWSSTTGVFVVNPEGDTTYGVSGVVSYVNRFGRTGPVPGRYKTYDPVGELHYETLRYLQGLQPSADAISGPPSPTMYDGFPAYLSWTDPYAGRSNTNDYSCVKSNIVVIGDVNTHDGNRLPSPSAANNIPDINGWRTVVQNFEKNVTSTYVDGQGVSRSTGNPNGANGSVPTSTRESQIMGSAYWARTHDIRGTDWTNSVAQQRPGLRVKSFLFDVNEYAQQTGAGHRTGNQFFMASKYGGFETDASNQNPAPYNLAYNSQGNPFKRNDGTVDKYVWEDTNTDSSRVGEANTYFQLGLQPRNVLSAFEDIFLKASSTQRSIAGGAIASKNLTVASTVFQGLFDTSNWTGDLLASPVSVGTGNVVTIGTTPTWTAATRLGLLPAPATSRNIVIGNTGATANPVAADFKWASIETSLKAALDKSVPGAADDGFAEDRLNYIRGSRSKEGNPFRIRATLLGDIVNSGVAYSGVPASNINGSGYAAFRSTNASRTPTVIVGANDGMLHAFNATTGDELFAYIPSWLGPKLPALTNSSYVNSHQSYLDGTPVVAEAEVGAGNWKTVLVSGTGGGGQGVFALDITDPTTFSASKVLWEFTDADDPDLGNVTGRPAILRMRTSATGGASATYKWFAVFGSGVNNYANDANFSTTGAPALFLLDLSKPVGTAWSLNSNYYKVSLPVDTTLSATKAPGLINFSAAIGNAGEVTQVLMGDLHGNLWKLDFSLVGIADWNLDKLSSFNKGTSGSPIPYPMFIAKDSSNNPQPITAAPSLAFGPEPGTRYIIFGTGKYLEVGDKSTTGQQSTYMVYDNGTTTADSSPAGASAISSRARLKAATSVTGGLVTIAAFRPGRATVDTGVLVNPVASGWYFDLPVSKERQISESVIVGPLVRVNTLIPALSGTAGTCSATGGSGQGYLINYGTGNGTITSTTSIPGETLTSEISHSYSPSDSTGRRIKTIVTSVITQTSNLPDVQVTTTTAIAGRLSWRQINNYQDLKNAP